MAQQGHSDHHDDNGADTTSYIFNPMSYNYAQHQTFSPPTVLSQQDATVMADFFNNPDTSNTDNTYLNYGIDGKPDLANAHMPSHHNALTSQSALTNAHVQQSHVNFNSHPMPQTASNRLSMNMYDYSSSFLQNNHHHLQRSSNTHSAGDAVAGASALLGLSTSQEQANLLGANNYMTWPNIVGAHLQAPTNNINTAAPTAMSPVRVPAVGSSSAVQMQDQLQPPPPQPPATSWAEISAAELSQRARHPSLQLDTTNTHMPTHQQTWQTVPLSAAPHVGRRPPMVKFGSDNHFSPNGFTGPATNQQNEKQNNLLHMAGGTNLLTGTSKSAAQAQRAIPALAHRHSIAAGMPVTPAAHDPPVLLGGMSSPAQQLQAPFHTGLDAGTSTSNGTGRKRNFSQVDNSPITQSTSDLARPNSNLPENLTSQRRTSSGQRGSANGTADARPQAAQSTSTQPVAAPTAPAVRRRNANPNRDNRAPRQNLTDAQKRQNHIASEQKRRDTMKTNYEILGQRVSAVRDGGAMSRSEILYHLANHMETIIAGNRIMCRLAGVTLEQLDAMPDPEHE